MEIRKLSRLLGAIALMFLLVGLAQAAEFSAAVVSKGANYEKQAKIYVKGDKVRREFTTSRGTSTVILRPDKKMIWMLMPGQQVYLDMPFDKEAFAQTMNLPGDQVSKKLLGTEKLFGYDTEKYESSIKTDYGELKSTIWIAPKLGMPIKIVSEDKSFVQEYRDIKEGGLDDSLFEIPAGYQKMPAMPKMK